MFRSEQIEEGSQAYQDYVQRRQQAFPRLQIPHDGVHVGLYYDEDLVGGATLLTFETVADDELIASNWEIARDFGGTRIARLWTQRHQQAQILPQLFAELYARMDPASFLYGVLAFSLEEAHLKSDLFEDHLGWLRAKKPLRECHWEQTEQPSSQGKKLLPAYRTMGAPFLGPASGDETSQTVRIVLGMPFLDVGKRALPF